MKKYFRELQKLADANGAVVDFEHKHPQIVGDSWRVTVSRTPSCPYALQNARRDVQRYAKGGAA